ncbi:ABC transporter ATP-binding protein [Streptomyces lavendulocolor]|uniref:ABC transporter ATP-binding protein n=1 Tax=Streptomyces lavendulocolor TaxID=67316 RepID=UPI003C2C01F1
MQAQDDPPVLDIERLTCHVPGRTLFEDVTLSVRAGESVAVTGPSGSGKSTLLMSVLGLVRPAAGTVRVAGADLGAMSSRVLARHRRRHMGMVFQFGELLPELSPLENVALAGLLGGMGPGAADRRAARLLDELGVHPVDGRVDTLSGGERQRTAVARALMNEPALLLADEPTGSLDPVHRDAVTELLHTLPATRGCALLLVTHDEAVARRADRCVTLGAGGLVPQDATAAPGPHASSAGEPYTAPPGSRMPADRSGSRTGARS